MLPDTAIAPARPLWDTAPLCARERVVILVGGYRDDCGRILSVVHHAAGDEPRLSVYLDSGVTVMGYKPSELRRVSL
jgi:hypothetical protein